MSALSLEARVAALEEEVRRLKLTWERDREKAGWRKMVGAFLNDPYFEKAMEYGRQYRESLRPKKKAKRKLRHGGA
jgi:hypothetical protein